MPKFSGAFGAEDKCSTAPGTAPKKTQNFRAPTRDFPFVNAQNFLRAFSAVYCSTNQLTSCTVRKETLRCRVLILFVEVVALNSKFFAK